MTPLEKKSASAAAHTCWWSGLVTTEISQNRAAWHGGVWYASEDTPLVNNLDAPAEFFQQIKSGMRLFFFLKCITWLFQSSIMKSPELGIVVSNWIFIHLAPLFFYCELYWRLILVEPVSFRWFIIIIENWFSLV